MLSGKILPYFAQIMKKIVLYFLLLFFPVLSLAEEVLPPLSCEPQPLEVPSHKINFSKVTAAELLRFISRITKTSFIFNEKDLQFEVSFVSGKETSEEQILHSIMTLLSQKGFHVNGKKGCFVVEKQLEGEVKQTPIMEGSPIPIIPKELPSLAHSLALKNDEEIFHVYKLQYHVGSDLEGAIKQLAASSRKNDPAFTEAIQSMQWIKSTNSLVFSASPSVLSRLLPLIKSLDTPQKQVYIEVLVLETDLKNEEDFGLHWSAQSKYKDRLNLSLGTGGKHAKGQHFKDQLNSMNPLSGGGGLNLGVIGDIITHKGGSFLQLSSLVSALQQDHSHSIVLHHKVIAQDNKTSKIFVGDNIPFAGSVVETIGSAQQTTSNIEYKDIGVSLNITPYIGDNGVITLEISEDITEANERILAQTRQMTGIQTTKTSMVNRVHVPDSHFLALTGMVRNKKYKAKTGLPCLGGLPLIGAAFAHKEDNAEKRNIIIFVRPTLIQNFEDGDAIANQEWNQAKDLLTDKNLIQDIEF